MTVKLVGSTSGSVSLQAPASTSGGAHRVLTLPDANATLATTSDSFGKILQVVSTTTTSVSSVSVATGAFGTLGPTVTITPSSSSNKVLITSAIEVSCEIQANHDYRLLANGSLITAALGDAAGIRKQATGTNESYHTESSALLSINFLHSANTTSAVTYSIQVSHSSTSTRTIYCNRSGHDGNEAKLARYTSTITAMEVAA